KYIAQAVHDREISVPGCTEDDLLSFAAEESHGYLVTPHIRDKDAVSAAIYLAALEERLASDGKDFVDYLASIYDEIGRFGDVGRSVLMQGSRGVGQIEDIMSSLRADPPTRLGRHKVTEVIDHWDEHRFGPFSSATDREARNVIVLAFSRGRVTFRP